MLKDSPWPPLGPESASRHRTGTFFLSHNTMENWSFELFSLPSSLVHSFWGQIFTEHKQCAGAQYILVNKKPVLWELAL